MGEKEREDVSKANVEGLADLLGEGLARSGSSTSDEGSGTPEAAQYADTASHPTELPGGSSLDIEGYRIIRELSRGGQGVVYEALQKVTKRKVALKVLVGGPYATKIARKRFEREIELVAQLKHPNIITVFHSGLTPDGQQFCVMDYVRGKPLHRYVRDKKLALEEILKLVATVCDAVQYAHQRGVIHRDLKPSNIVVDADGNPKILDFGLAKQMAAPIETVVSISQQVLGTLPYMSPEQAGGNPDEIDTRTDIYALGVVLFELLTGHYPYPVEGQFADVLHHITETVPTLARRAWSGDTGVTRRSTRRLRAGECPIDDEVETILLKALAKERERRYQSAGELARDIRHYLGGEAIEAKRDSFVYMLRKQLRKYKLAAMVAAAFVIVVAAGLVTSLSFGISAAAERERLRQTVYFNHIGLAQAAYDGNHIARMNKLLDTCPPDLRGWEWYYLFLISDRSERTFLGHVRAFRYSGEAGVRSAAFSPDDGRLIVSGGQDKMVRLWDTATGDQILPPLAGHDKTVACVAFSPDGKWIVSGSWDKTLKVWDPGTGEETLTIPGHQDAVFSVACSPDSRWIVSGGRDKTVRIWDARTGENKLTIEKHEDEITCVVFSPKGQRIASASLDGTIRVWDARTGDELGMLRGHYGSDGGVGEVAFSPDGKWIASGSEDKTLKVWDAGTGEEILAIEAETEILCVTFSPDGRWISSGGVDRTVRVWDANTGENLRSFVGHDFPITSVSFSPDGRWILSASEDFTVKLWDTSTGADTRVLRGHTEGVRSVSFSPDGRRIVSGSSDKTLIIWDASTGENKRTLPGHESGVAAVAISQDGRRIVSGSGDGTLKVWDAVTGENKRTLPGHESGVYSAAFSPDGRRIVSGGHDNTVRVWEASTGQEKLILRGHGGPVFTVAFSPDGQWIASGSEDTTLKVWGASAGEEPLTLRGHRYPVTCVAFSPDGRRIASGSWDDTVRVWDARTGTQILELEAHEYDVYSVAFSPDGRRIISGSADKTLKVWDASTGAEALTLRAHDSAVYSAAFSPDGRLIVSGSQDNTVRVWESATEEQVEQRLLERSRSPGQRR